MNVPVIDLHKSSETLILKEGVENSKRFFLHIPEGHFKTQKALRPTIHILVNMVHNQWHHWFARPLKNRICLW
jgi:hypothetical protein